MNDKELYRQKYQAQLDELKAEVAKLAELATAGEERWAGVGAATAKFKEQKEQTR